MNYLTTPEFYYCLQLLLALSLGLILGTERTFAGRTAGMRTYALVSMGSCLLIVMSNNVIASAASSLDPDPLRLAAGIVTGIGFLGAGIIIFKEGDSKITGLTTAAGLWVACAIGMAVGYSLYTIAIFGTILTILSFSVLWHVEMGIKRISEKAHKGIE